MYCIIKKDFGFFKRFQYFSMLIMYPMTLLFWDFIISSKQQISSIVSLEFVILPVLISVFPASLLSVKKFNSSSFTFLCVFFSMTVFAALGTYKNIFKKILVMKITVETKWLKICLKDFVNIILLLYPKKFWKSQSWKF